MITLGDRAEMALRIVREAPLIAYDVETSGVDWRVNQPVGYVITESRENNFYIPIRHGGGANLLDPRVMPMETPTDKIVVHEWERELQKAFEERRQRNHKTIGHHLKFDMHMSANAGVMLGRNCGCTQNNAAMLDEYRRSFSLENVAKSEGVTPKLGDALYERLAQLFGGEAKRSQMEHYWRIAGDDPAAVEYSLGDGITTLEVWHSQVAEINAQEMGLIHGIESELIWTLFRMERRGIKVDEQYIGELEEAIDAELSAARAVLPLGLNVKSPVQMRKLFEDAGITNWPTTDAGNPSFTESFLKQSDLGKAVVAVRQLSTLGSSFITPLKERFIFEGRVHATLNQLKADETGTVAGRLSCSDPNLQAVHKRNKVLGRKFRKVYVADEDMEFCEDDYSQCEPRLFAHYSQEPSLLEGYNQVPFRDVHSVVAEMLDVERDPTAKRMNMGILTGMQTASFAGHMNWPIDRATQAFNAWFEAFPGIKGFQDQAKAVFRSRGYVKTILGRRCRLEQARFAYRGTSRIIQGSNADILKERLLACDKYLESQGDLIHLLMTVHDSIEYQKPMGAEGDRQRAEMRALMVDVQSAPYNLRVPFVMDSGQGRNWAEATYGPENPQ